MSVSRLETAMDAAGVSLAEGIGAFNGTVSEVGFLDPQTVEIEQGFRPDYDRAMRAGYRTSPVIKGPFPISTVHVPRSKAAARELIRRASVASPKGLVFVDGQKTDGIESLFKAARQQVSVLGSVTKSHGRCFWFEGGGAFAGWTAAPIHLEDGFQTRVGVFSAEKIDKGSELLVASLPAKLSGRVADLGAGWGYVSSAILKRDGVKELDVIEADYTALECAKINISDKRASFQWADVITFKTQKYDAIVTNPPFHTGRAGDPRLGQTFIECAIRLLKPSGTLWLVANRHLPYEDTLKAGFQSVSEIGGDGRFKLIQASRPRARF